MSYPMYHDNTMSRMKQNMVDGRVLSQHQKPTNMGVNSNMSPTMQSNIPPSLLYKYRRNVMSGGGNIPQSHVNMNYTMARDIPMKHQNQGSSKNIYSLSQNSLNLNNKMYMENNNIQMTLPQSTNYSISSSISPEVNTNSSLQNNSPNSGYNSTTVNTSVNGEVINSVGSSSFPSNDINTGMSFQLKNIYNNNCYY
ncbi:hypothetical protein BCR32DRAFT_270487 [Anaeromyces robustus]|uniref:Uncharacterized protein n=1 Tax=Anaeromyces robustus TaxID=1754192 RepID=A0A1Y1WX73_9FUNG|nr:hypothetical protein BCR32DRAFT_270487 [Anaeromyces robustus]|eukprot:ORX77724.1 hypothetical protein BCR32DRAFT_270487 [Anaeromyces robustus]